jgi:hypothetical protein
MDAPGWSGLNTQLGLSQAGLHKSENTPRPGWFISTPREAAAKQRLTSGIKKAQRF